MSVCTELLMYPTDFGSDFDTSFINQYFGPNAKMANVAYLRSENPCTLTSNASITYDLYRICKADDSMSSRLSMYGNLMPQIFRVRFQ